MGHVHHWRRVLPVRDSARRDFAQQVGFRVADVDLAAGDVEGPPIECDLTREAGDGVLGRRVGRGAFARNMGRDGAVHDDATAPGRLAAHQPERHARAQEHAREIHIDGAVPVFERDLVEGKRLAIGGMGPAGLIAVQLARAWGAEQVIGIAGSDKKCAWVKETAGFDACLNYKTEADLGEAIDAAMPDGIDILFDNVGNSMVELCLPRMRMGGRIVISGQVADYNLEGDAVPPIRSTKPFITHRVRMEGLVVFDDARAFPEALETMAGMIAKGELRFDGLETMPEAFCGLFRGENLGRRIVKVGDV